MGTSATSLIRQDPPLLVQETCLHLYPRKFLRVHYLSVQRRKGPWIILLPFRPPYDHHTRRN